MRLCYPAWEEVLCLWLLRMDSARIMDDFYRIFSPFLQLYYQSHQKTLTSNAARGIFTELAGGALHKQSMCILMFSPEECYFSGGVTW